MRKSLFIGLFSLTGLLLAGCQSAPVSEPPATHTVRHYGAMRTFMMKGDLSGQVQLDTLPRTNLYGLGVAEGLRGELLIWNGKAAHTRVAAGNSTATDTAWTGRAALLVTSRVPQWQPAEPVPAAVADYAALQQHIENRAAAQGLDTSRAFAFRLSGQPEQVQWHVMDWPATAGPHTMEGHKKYATTGRFRQQQVELLGFFSRRHQAVFTHHTTFMHLHVRPANEAFAAHVDSLRWLPGQLLLHLPAAQ
ncbi:acetolactate decarboxylase [Hymenobacter koreensis]|uniref:Acetolactate decarboxylase n=1 Tax=Hymenobacter koreensis TaxID=1084523 RepID=A0ABP8IYX9_9BACT